VREPAEHRLFGQRQLRRIRPRRPQLCRPPAGQCRLYRHRADPVRGRYRLQGTEGDRGQAGRVGRGLRHRRPGSHGRAVRQGDGAQRGGGRHRRPQARSGDTPWRGRDRQRPRAGSRRRDQGGDRRRAGRPRHRRLAQGLPAGARHGPARRHGGPQWPAARRFSAVDLRHRAQRRHRPRLDRRHPARPDGGAGLRRRGQGSRDCPHRTAREDQRRLRRMHHGDIEGRIVLDLA